MLVCLRFCRIVILMDPPSTAIPHFVNLLIPHTQTSSSIWSTYAKESCLRPSISSTCAIATLPKRSKKCVSKKSDAQPFLQMHMTRWRDGYGCRQSRSEPKCGPFGANPYTVRSNTENRSQIASEIPRCRSGTCARRSARTISTGFRGRDLPQRQDRCGYLK